MLKLQNNCLSVLIRISTLGKADENFKFFFIRFSPIFRCVTNRNFQKCHFLTLELIKKFSKQHLCFNFQSVPNTKNSYVSKVSSLTSASELFFTCFIATFLFCEVNKIYNNVEICQYVTRKAHTGTKWLGAVVTMPDFTGQSKFDCMPSSKKVKTPKKKFLQKGTDQVKQFFYSKNFWTFPNCSNKMVNHALIRNYESLAQIFNFCPKTQQSINQKAFIVSSHNKSYDEIND